MKKILLAIMILLGIQQSYAQIGDKLIPHMGFLYQWVAIEDNSFAPPFERSPAFYAFNLGTYYQIAHTNDIASVGVDGSINFGFSFVNDFSTGSTRVNIFSQFPFFLMGRLGANSTAYNQQKFGLGLGIGGHYTLYSNKGFAEKSNFINPAAIAEITILSRTGTLTVRGTMSLSQTESMLINTETKADIGLRDFGSFGVGLIYGF